MPQIVTEEDANREARRRWVADSVDEIAQRTKVAMKERGLTFPIFFLVPTSGAALVTIGTNYEPDPTDEEWDAASAIAVKAVEEVLGLDKLVSRSIACAVAQPSQTEDATNATA